MNKFRPLGLIKAACLGAVAISVTTLGGCATVTRGTHQDWTITSDPVGASVTTSNGFACDATPCTFDVPRKPAFDVTVSKPGYKTVTVTTESKVAASGGAAMAGNLLAGGIIGGIVDGNNGSMNDITPNPLNVVLEKEDGDAAQ